MMDCPRAHVPSGTTNAMLAGAIKVLEVSLKPVQLRPVGQRYINEKDEAVIASGKEPRWDDFAGSALIADDESVCRWYGLNPDTGLSIQLGLTYGLRKKDRSFEPADGFVDVEEDDPLKERAVWESALADGIPETLRFRSSGTGDPPRASNQVVGWRAGPPCGPGG
jgi:hypothetical protein